MKNTLKIERRRSRIHGHGVFAIADIAPGEEIVEYKGKVITHDEANDTYGGTAESGHTFLFTLNDEYIIDGNVGGNVARWINHSCAPNAQAFRIDDDSGDIAKERVVIEAKRAIAAGEELTYDYGIRLEERHSRRMRLIWACRCGAPECSGTMLKSKPKSRSRKEREAEQIETGA